MQDLGFLNVQEIHAFGDVKSHAEPLPHGKLDGLFLVQQREQSPSETELCQDKHMAALVVCARSHKVHQIGVADLDQRGYLAFKLFGQVVLARVLPIVRKLELLDGDVVFFVSRLEHIGTRTRSNLLLESDVVQIYPEVILGLLELFAEDFARLLGLSFGACIVRRCGDAPWAFVLRSLV